jgi:hypothetical protein
MLDLSEIIKYAQGYGIDAIQFAKFLDTNNIQWTALDITLTNYNKGYFNILLDDFNDENILFTNGIYQR